MRRLARQLASFPPLLHHEPVMDVISRVLFFVKKHKRIIYPVINILGATYTLVMILIVALINVFHTCPVLYGDDACRFPIMVAAVMFFQVCSNLFLIHYAMKINKVSYWTKEGSFLLPKSVRPKIQEACQEGAPLPGNPQLGKFCFECNLNAPRRSLHCPLCDVCVLRCDHHCFLTGACLGIGNQRYFVVWLAWICVGAAYSLKYMTIYMYTFIAPKFVFDYLSFWVPFAFFKWIFGFETFFNVILAALVNSTFWAVSMSSIAIGGQIFFIIKGNNMWDYRKSIKCDGINLKERFELIFGRNWYLNFIFPQFWNRNVMTEEIATNIFLISTKDV